MGLYIEDLPPSQATINKAARFIETGSIARLEARVYTVDGDTGTYAVVIYKGVDADIRHTCSCEARTTCAHILAAMKLSARLDKRQRRKGRVRPAKK